MPLLRDSHLSYLEAFKLVWTGWFWGVGSIFFSVFAVTALLIAFTGPDRALQGLLATVMVPVIVAGQAVVFGGVVVFGLWLHDRLVSRWNGKPKAGDVV